MTAGYRKARSGSAWRQKRRTKRFGSGTSKRKSLCGPKRTRRITEGQVRPSQTWTGGKIKFTQKSANRLSTVSRKRLRGQVIHGRRNIVFGGQMGRGHTSMTGLALPETRTVRLGGLSVQCWMLRKECLLGRLC